MRFTYDDEVDALYIYVREDGVVESSLEIDAGRVVDLDEHSRAIGIEILDASLGIRLTDLIDRFQLGHLRANLGVLESTPFHPMEHA